jgi:hypothetical protein
LPNAGDFCSQKIAAKKKYPVAYDTDKSYAELKKNNFNIRKPMNVQVSTLFAKIWQVSPIA